MVPDDVFLGSQAVAAGVLTRGQLRGPAVQRLFQDTYLRAGVKVTHVVRCRGATRALPQGAVITGRSAAAVRGVPIAWPDDPVQVIAPPEMRLGRRTGLDVRRTEIDPADVEPWGFGLLASPMRMTLDLLLGRDLPDAVADLDAVLRRELVDRSALASMLATRSDNGIVLARQAETLADPRADSRPESKLRVILHLAGLRPEPQFWIEDRTGRLVCVDLAFPEHKVAVEYDGDWRDGEQWALNRDRDRLNRVHAAGWTVIFITAPMLRNPRAVVRTVAAALPQHFGARTLLTRAPRQQSGSEVRGMG